MKNRSSARACFKNQSSKRVRFKKRSTALYRNSSWSIFFFNESVHLIDFETLISMWSIFHRIDWNHRQFLMWPYWTQNRNSELDWVVLCYVRMGLTLCFEYSLRLSYYVSSTQQPRLCLSDCFGYSRLEKFLAAELRDPTNAISLAHTTFWGLADVDFEWK